MNFNYGNPYPPAPASADINHPGQNFTQQGQTPQGAQGNGQNLKDVIEAGEQARARDPGIAYGQTHGALTGFQRERMAQYPGWDGDLRWPPADFLAGERARTDRLQAMDRQKQEIAWQQGQTQKAQLRRDQAEADADLWAQRARQ